MAYTNNRLRLINTKMTAIGRKKIATGNLKLHSYSFGDSEINYVREDYNVDNGINSPARILKACDSQPDLKYYLTNNNEDIRTILSPNDIDVTQLTLNNKTTPIGITLGDVYKFKNGVVAGSGTTLTISGGYVDIASVGDIIHIYDSTNDMTSVYTVVEVNGVTLTLNKSLPSVITNLVYDVMYGGEVETVPEWNPAPTYVWNNDVMEYEVSPSNLPRTPLWSMNVILMEDIAGYFKKKEETLGYNFIGLMENYLSYNDDLNVTTPVTVDNCSDESIAGIQDPYQKMIGVIHYTNSTNSNFYGDSFFINDSNKLTLKMGVRYNTNISDISISSSGSVKTIIDSNIKYYDMVIVGTDTVVGKAIPDHKIVIIDDEELLMTMSIGSGRQTALPTIQTQLIPTNEEGLLPSGKQMYVTYRFPSSVTFNEVHCMKYNLITNTSKTSKDVEIFFNAGDFTSFSSTSQQIYGFEVLYQITDIGERPNPSRWLTKDLTSELGLTTNVTQNINIVKNLKKTLDSTTTIYNLEKVTIGAIGDDTYFYGDLSASISSLVYRSIIRIQANPNTLVKTTNPTYLDVGGEKPFLVVSEVGVYDEDDDLVMISKLTQPITLSYNSTVSIEIGLDF